MKDSKRTFENEHKCGKMRILVFKKKTVFIALISLVLIGACVGGGVLFASVTRESPVGKPLIVIDPGHGGIDAGVTGSGGTKEADFNLAMSLELEKYLTDAGFRVILTRKDNKGLYGNDMENFKRKDMAVRKKIIKENNPDLVISIHANKYPDATRRGAQVFFDSFNAGGKSLASDIQTGLNALNKQYVERTYSALSGDYFILKCTLKPSVIVECGFMSNPEDEKLLNSESYRQEIAFSIYSGVVTYLTADVDCEWNIDAPQTNMSIAR